MPDETPAAEKPQTCASPLACPLNRPVTTFVMGLVVGVVLAVIAATVIFPRVMLTTRVSRFGHAETVAALQKSLADTGWSSPGTLDMNKSMAKQGVEMKPRVAVVELCKPEYAKEVLTDVRDVSAIMPCRIAVWEGDDGKTYVTSMNTGLMGRLFGGTVARVMGGSVAADEAKILAPVLAE